MKTIKKKKLRFPKIVKVNKDTLEHKNVNLWVFGSILLVVLSVISFIFYQTGRLGNISKLNNFEKELLILNFQQKDDFSEKELIEMLKDLNVKYPYIVLAQSRIETGRFTSKIFRENHNLFGMRQARIRINTAKGTQYNHAYYETWRESVYDYAFYQARYLNNAKTEEEYFYTLGQSYAEAPRYVEALKSEIKRYNLKDKFK